MEALVGQAVSIGSKLKAFTAAHHDKIEQHALTRAIVEGTITRESYVLLLSKFYGFYAACEPPLEQTTFWQQAGFDIKNRRKTPSLRQDLQFFNIDPASLPMCTDLPPLQTDAQRLGFLYVVEGATLGGQVLSRALATKFGFTARQGAAYFNSYGVENIGAMWKQVQALLTDFASKHLELESELLQAALLTFQKLDTWLNA
ncbi:MAG: biliverdin-producing heme oxygenase [Cytophagales bacterium]|nr:biliverdin-producing heme oxygenase [Cytophagales bacterium]